MSATDMTLCPRSGFSKPTGPVALIVLDGVGVADKTEWNAWAQAYTPFFDSLVTGNGPDGAAVLYTELDAAGFSVGLPEMTDMGNSEVGHNALGAGRVFNQGAKLVNEAFNTGAFKDSATWKWLCEEPAKSAENATLHLLGLFSDGKIHSHVDHVYALLEQAVIEGVKSIRVHALADGRDVSDRSVMSFVGPLEERLAAMRADGCDARIASGGGRMVCTMDRYEADWGIVERGWYAQVLGDRKKALPFPSYAAAVEELYKDPKMVDQYLPGFVIVDDDGAPVGTIEDNDSVLFFNFRGDRAIEVTAAFEAAEGEFPHFDRVRVPKVRYAGMMEYDGDAKIPKKFLVAPPVIKRTVPEYVVRNGMKRYSCSETHKYGHVTYFFSGNRAAKFDDKLEKYVCVQSYTEREATRPWMKCAEVTDSVLADMDDFQPDLMVINYPGGDMCGHTGSMKAARISCECIDLSLERLVPEIVKRGGQVIITADHGNCEIMAETNKDGTVKKGNQPEGWQAHGKHTTQPVPCIIVGKGIEKYAIDPAARWADIPECKSAGIANVGPTLLNMLGLAGPSDYLPSLLKMK
jgi:2,3-bisphosphoglycerate-independent phosphoglycerate mutase